MMIETIDFNNMARPYKYYPKLCPICLQPFKTRYSKKIYCSKACYFKIINESNKIYQDEYRKLKKRIKLGVMEHAMQEEK